MPLQAPDAAQAVALADDQVMVVAVLVGIVLAPAVILTVGTGCVTETVVDWDAVPPGPVQARLKVVLAITGAVVTVPWGSAGVSLQPPPEAVQAVALEAEYCSVTGLPATVVLGVATSCTTGGLPATVTVTDCVAEPPQPVQSRVYSVVLVNGPVNCEPLVGIGPFQPSPLDAVQLLAWETLHVSVVSAPLAMVVSAAVSVIFGASCRARTWVLAILDPLGPLQVTAKVVVSVMVGTGMVPLVGTEPVIPLVPTHSVAAVLCRISEVPLPISTTLAVGVSETVGPALLLDWQAARAVKVTRPRANRSVG